MKMNYLAILAIVLCSPAGASETTKTTIKHPGLVYGDFLERRRVLSGVDKPFPRQYCKPEKVCSYPPVSIIDAGNRVSGQTAARQGLSLWGGVAEYLRTGSVNGLENARQVINNWVEADALASVKGHMPLARHYMKRTLFPVITTYAAIRQVLNPPLSERKRVEAWIKRGVDMMDKDNHDGHILSDANNSRYSRDAVNMAWGILSNDIKSYKKGINRFQEVLIDMRPNGSLPWETNRGARAVSYQNLAVSILVPMAEMATLQGDNLYGQTYQGRSIHDAVAFLIAAEKDVSLIKTYTRAKQDKIRLGNHLHWTEIYLARFPDHENTNGLHDLRRRYHFLTGRGNDFAGGNLSCLFAEPQTNPVLIARPPKKKIAAINRITTVPRVSCPRYLD